MGLFSKYKNKVNQKEDKFMRDKLEKLGGDVYKLCYLPEPSDLTLSDEGEFIRLLNSEGIKSVFEYSLLMTLDELLITQEVLDTALQGYINTSGVTKLIQPDLDDHQRKVLSVDLNIPYKTIYTAVCDGHRVMYIKDTNPDLNSIYETYGSIDPDEVLEYILEKHTDAIEELEKDKEAEEYKVAEQLLIKLCSELCTDIEFARKSEYDKRAHFIKVIGEEEYKKLASLFTTNLEGRLILNADGERLLENLTLEAVEHLDSVVAKLKAKMSNLIKADENFTRQTSQARRANYLMQWFKDNNTSGEYDLLYDIFVTRGRQKQIIISAAGKDYIDTLYKEIKEI